MAGGDSNAYDSIKHRGIFALSNVAFVMALLLAGVFEATLILRVWIRPRLPIDGLTAFALQFMVLTPALLILALRLVTGKQLRKGGISPSFASILSLNLGILLTLVYLALMQTLTFVPR